MLRIIGRFAKGRIGDLPNYQKCADLNLLKNGNDQGNTRSYMHRNLKRLQIQNNQSVFLSHQKSIAMSNIYSNYILHKSIWNFNDMLSELHAIGNSLVNKQQVLSHPAPTSTDVSTDRIVVSSDDDCIVLSSEEDVAVVHKRNLKKANRKRKKIKTVATKTAIQQRLLSTRSNHINSLARLFSTNNRLINTVPEEPSGSIETEATQEDIRKVLKLYPRPKQSLNNIFITVSNHLNSKAYLMNPSFRAQKGCRSASVWNATYNLKWPKEISFTAMGQTKQAASTNAAVLVLHYLLSNGKIKNDYALLDDVDVSSNSSLNRIQTLKLDTDTVDILKTIYDLHTKEFVPKLVSDLTADSSTLTFKSSVSMWPINATPRKLKGTAHYLTRESVNLPISEFREHIIKTAKENRVVVIKGEPGCGKSTRVPQYILEGWALDRSSDDCRIVITQPRRIAAISLAERVSNERGEALGSTVGYQVRLKSNFSRNHGHILYCTTGILLRKLQNDPKLSDCTHIILDEAHERDVNTDLLLNLLRRALNENPNLRVLVMSATIKAEIFTEYFKEAASIHIPGFTYPVKVKFLNEKMGLEKTMKMCQNGVPTLIPEDVAKFIMNLHRHKPEGAILAFLPGWDEIVKVKNCLPRYDQTMQILCLHSRMPITEQKLIFHNFPPGVRKVILATNIAETSVTVNDVVYVVDSGIQKEQRFDVERGIVCLDNHWISKASMNQRKGRAGRVQPGESFHLYPKEQFDTFDDYSIPEILRTSLTKIVLDSKVFTNNMKATDFLGELIAPPDVLATDGAVEELVDLELLDADENLTPLGRVLSDFQLEPKLAKAMVNAIIFKCVTPIVDIVTLFSSELEIFNSGLTDREGVNRVKKQYSHTSDHLALMRLLEQWLAYVETDDSQGANSFCRQQGVIDYKLNTLKQLRDIHFEYLHKGLHNILSISDQFSDSDELVKAVILSGVGTILEHRNYDVVKGRIKNKNLLLTRNKHKATISSASVNFKRKEYPSEYLLYINETRSNIRRTTVIRETSIITPLTVLLFKNNPIVIEKYNFNGPNNGDQVVVKLDGTDIKFICDKETADSLKKCKEALLSAIQYYIYQLTVGADYDGKLNEIWDEILQNLNDALTKEAGNITF